MTLAAVAFTAALVAQDQVALRASPHDSAPKPATLWQGDLLEVRGERGGYLQVYDPRRERPGYVRPSQVHVFALDESSGPSLKAVVEFLKDAPGAESLGIAYVAAYLKVATAEQVSPSVFDALGTMADRLARRASMKHAGPSDELAGHLDVAGSYGVRFRSYERGERTQVCYDGEAFRRVLALGGSPDERARAALALTRPECMEDGLGPTQLRALEQWQAGVLEQVDAGAALPLYGNRVRMRLAAVSASLAFHDARAGADPAPSAERARRALATVARAELADEDLPTYAEASARVGASRWASEAVAPAKGSLPALYGTAGEPGQTCIHVGNLERCTYSQVWLGSARFSADGDAVALAVQPAPAWTELWVFRRSGTGWTVDSIVPAAVDPDVGYVEAAGWSPDGKHLLVVREARVDGQWHRGFEVLNAATLAVQKRATRADALVAFHRWSDPAWRAASVALR